MPAKLVKAPPAAPPPNAYRIGELAKRAGVAVATVKYYIREGLLPAAPYKTGRTMAWYDDAYLERLRVVRALREEHFLPVRVIKDVLAERGHGPLAPADAALLARIGPNILRRLEPPASEPLSRAALLREHRLAEAELALLEEMGLVGDGRGRQKRFTPADGELLVALAAAEAAGLSRERFPLAGLGHYVELLGELARREVRVFTHGVKGLPLAELESLAERALAASAPIVATIHRKLVVRALREELYGPAAVRKKEPR